MITVSALADKILMLLMMMLMLLWRPVSCVAMLDVAVLQRLAYWCFWLCCCCCWCVLQFSMSCKDWQADWGAACQSVKLKICWMVNSSPAAQHSGIHAKGGRGWVVQLFFWYFFPTPNTKKVFFFKNALLFKVKHYSAELCSSGLGCVCLPRGLIGANRARSAIGGSFRITHLLAFCHMISLDPAETLNSTSLSRIRYFWSYL